MAYIGRTPTFGKFAAGAEARNLVDGDLKVTGDISSNDTLFKMVMDTAANEFDNILIEDGGTDGSGANAGDDICLEKETSNIVTVGANSQEKSNIMLNSFRISINGSLVKFDMVDGVVDQFEDESATADGNLANEVYDATGDFYQPDDLSDISTSVGTWTATNTNAGDPNGIGDGGGTATNWRSENVSGASVTLDLGSGNTVVANKINLLQSNDAGQTTRFLFTASNNNSSYATIHDTSQSAEVTSGNFTHTMTTTDTAYRYFRLTAYKNSNYRFGLYQMTLFGAGAKKDMIIQSDSFTALTVPTESFITILHEPIDTVTLNSDFTAEVSRDGGTNFTAVTLTKEVDLASGDIVSGLVDLTSQPSGTSLQYRLKTFNARDQKIHAVALEWK